MGLRERGRTAGGLLAALSAVGALAGDARAAGRRLVIDDLRVEGAALRIERGADGRLALPALRLAAPGPRPALGVELERAELRAAELTFRDQAVAPEPHVIRLVGLRAALRRGPRGLQVSASAALSAGGEPGSLRLAGELEGSAPGRRGLLLRARGLELAALLPYLRGSIGARDGRGRLDGHLRLAAGGPQGLAGHGELRLRTGELDLAGARFAGPLALRGGFTAPGGRLALRGARARAHGVELGPHAAGELSARLDWTDSTLRVDELEFQAHGGRWLAEGRVEFGPGAPRFGVRVRAEEVSLDRLVAALSEEGPPRSGLGVLEGQAELRGRWIGPETWTSGAAGAGRIALRETTLPRPWLLEAIWRALFRRIPLVSMPALAPNRAAPLEHVSQSFELREGRLHTDDLEVVSADYRISGSGSAGLDGSLDYRLLVVLTPKGLGHMFAMAALPLPAAVERPLAPIPTRLSGQLGDPQFQPDVSRIPLAALRQLFRALLRR